MKLTCGTPFLIVRNLSDFRLYCVFTFADFKGKLTAVMLFRQSFSFSLQLHVWLF